MLLLGLVCMLALVAMSGASQPTRVRIRSAGSERTELLRQNNPTELKRSPTELLALLTSYLAHDAPLRPIGLLLMFSGDCVANRMSAAKETGLGSTACRGNRTSLGDGGRGDCKAGTPWWVAWTAPSATNGSDCRLPLLIWTAVMRRDAPAHARRSICEWSHSRKLCEILLHSRQKANRKPTVPPRRLRSRYRSRVSLLRFLLAPPRRARLGRPPSPPLRPRRIAVAELARLPFPSSTVTTRWVQRRGGGSFACRSICVKLPTLPERTPTARADPDKSALRSPAGLCESTAGAGMRQGARCRSCQTAAKTEGAAHRRPLVMIGRRARSSARGTPKGSG